MVRPRVESSWVDDYSALGHWDIQREGARSVRMYRNTDTQERLGIVLFYSLLGWLDGKG